MKTPHAMRRRPRRWRRVLRLLSLWGLVPPMALALYSLTEPWARARVGFVFGVSRNPSAAVLVVVGLVAVVAAGTAVASVRRPALAATVHLASGALLCTLAALAFRMVQNASVRFLGLVPIASVRPGQGLQHFVLAALLVIALGLLELYLVLAERRERARDPIPEPASPIDES